MSRGQARGLVSVLVVAVALVAVIAATLIPAAGVGVGLGSAGLAGVALAVFVAVSVGPGRIETVERLSWWWSRLRAGLGAALGNAGLVALVVSAIATLSWGAGRPLAFVIAVAVTNLVGYALLFFLMFAILAGLGGERVGLRSRVNEGMRASACNTIVVWASISGVLAVALLLASAGFAALAPVPEAVPEAVPEVEPSQATALAGLVRALGPVTAFVTELAYPRSYTRIFGVSCVGAQKLPW